MKELTLLCKIQGALLPSLELKDSDKDGTDTEEGLSSQPVPVNMAMFVCTHVCVLYVCFEKHLLIKSFSPSIRFATFS